MRVLVVVNQVSEEQCELWRTAAAEGSHEVVLAGARPRAHLDAYAPSARPPSGVDVALLRPVPLRPRADHLWWSYPGLRRTINRVRPDLVHVHGELWGVPTLQAVATHPRVVAHGADNRFRFGSALEDRVRTRVIDRQLRRLRGYASWNEAGAGLARERRPELPVAVLPGVVTPDPGPRASSRREDDRRRIGLVGRLVPEKGLRHLHDALAAVDRRRVPELVLHVVGDGEERTVAACAPGVEVVMHGRLGHAEALDVLAGCDVVAVPSADTPTWSEQYGRVAVEAMAHGVAVVASAVGALPEVVGDGGVLLPPRDVPAWAEALTRLLSDDDALARGARAARTRYERAHTPRHYARQLVDLWSRVDG